MTHNRVQTESIKISETVAGDVVVAGPRQRLALVVGHDGGALGDRGCGGLDFQAADDVDRRENVLLDLVARDADDIAAVGGGIVARRGDEPARLHAAALEAVAANAAGGSIVTILRGI